MIHRPAKSSQWKWLLCFAALGALLTIAVYGAVWFYKLPHAGHASSLSSLPQKVSLPKQFAAFPMSSVQWEYRDVFTNVYVLWGDAQPARAHEWAEAAHGRGEEIRFSAADPSVDDQVFRDYATGEELLYVGTLDTPYHHVQIFVGEHTTVLLSRK